ncbi:hypothetical protein SEA_YEET_235 [Mycobacterium phage Yeet]|nr:hypothetical protein SEA_HALLEY_243 [Mycobacterium phage Halley]AYB69716.1 hypothetical protein SEA_KALAH2_230 [Mycobacterium phage Kalah2]QDP43981.1 hypothetical protein SEA_DALLAS_239 [Mycobacterium phage Dallas]QED12387.1 hypothetical protein SEA_YEET_235 [Mycobacterium phage Yeet]
MITLPRWTRATYKHMTARRYDVIAEDASKGQRFYVWDAMGLNVAMVAIERDDWGLIDEVGEAVRLNTYDAGTWQNAEAIIRNAVNA